MSFLNATYQHHVGIVIQLDSSKYFESNGFHGAKTDGHKVSRILWFEQSFITKETYQKLTFGVRSVCKIYYILYQGLPNLLDQSCDEVTEVVDAAFCSAW